jgi:hypothetical protein
MNSIKVLEARFEISSAASQNRCKRLQYASHAFFADVTWILPHQSLGKGTCAMDCNRPNACLCQAFRGHARDHMNDIIVYHALSFRAPLEELIEVLIEPVTEDEPKAQASVVVDVSEILLHGRTDDMSRLCNLQSILCVSTNHD